MYPFISLLMLGTLADHYADRLHQARTDPERQFLQERFHYYDYRYKNYCH